MPRAVSLESGGAMPAGGAAEVGGRGLGVICLGVQRKSPVIQCKIKMGDFPSEGRVQSILHVLSALAPEHCVPCGEVVATWGLRISAVWLRFLSLLQQQQPSE